jgi:glyoxylase-like metal-dependent hydrolase (beta-lactamase superfamily II)
MPGLEDELGDVVRKARTGLGIDLADLARQTGMSEQDLKGVEVYTKHPNEAQVRRLADVLKLRPDQLWALAEDTWEAPEPSWRIGDGFTVECITNHYPEHCYVVTSSGGESFVVDPGGEAERVAQTATAGGRRPAGILITHNHRDHTEALVAVQQATGAPVFIHAADAQGAAGVPAAQVRTFSSDGDLRVGGVAVRVLHTPGHTPGSTTYVVRSGDDVAAFCGDTLFAGSAGNARAGYDAILHSVRQKILALPPHATLYPGHGPATTVANELERNPFA